MPGEGGEVGREERWEEGVREREGGRGGEGGRREKEGGERVREGMRE